MIYLKYIIFFCLILFQFTSSSYGLTKEWCIGAGQYGKQYPIKKKEACPTQARIEITSEEAAKNFLSGSGKKYLTNLIANGAICQNDKIDYKFIRELLKGKKDLGCVKQKTLAEKKAEEEAKIRALAEKLAKEEIARQLKVKQKEEEAKQKAIVAKKAKEDAARKKALAKKKAEKLAKQKAIAAKKAKEEELKQKVLNEKIQKIKDEAQFIVETLKEYVTTDNNKLDILEVSELLENYDNEKEKGWSDATIEKFEALYDYVQKDDGFVTYSSEKKTKQLVAYNEEIRQLREYLSSSQSSLKAFITKNLGSKNANEALKLAKETKVILKDFDVSKAMSLKNNISTWKAMNGVKEDKKYSFKILNKKLGSKKQSANKKVVQKLIQKPFKKVSESKDYEVGKFPEFLKNRYWFIYNSGGIKKSGHECNEIVKKSDISNFFIYTEKNYIKYNRSVRFNSNKETVRDIKKGFKFVNNEKNKAHLQYNCVSTYSKGDCTENVLIKYNPKNETINLTCSFKKYTKEKERVYNYVGINKSNCEQNSNYIAKWCSGYPKKIKVVEKKNTEKKKNKKRFDFGRDPKDLKMYRYTHHSFGTVRGQSAVFCHYSNGRKDPIGLTLWRKSGCLPYIRDYPNN